MSAQNYVCLQCGSVHGEPAQPPTENWYWRIWKHGRTGPFCSETCSKTFHLSTGFTLEEAMLILEVSHRTNNVAS